MIATLPVLVTAGTGVLVSVRVAGWVVVELVELPVEGLAMVDPLLVVACVLFALEVLEAVGVVDALVILEPLLVDTWVLFVREVLEMVGVPVDVLVIVEPLLVGTWVLFAVEVLEVAGVPVDVLVIVGPLLVADGVDTGLLVTLLV